MALNWNKINVQNNQSKSNNKGLDWSKVNKTKEVDPVVSTLKNASVIQTANDVKKPTLTYEQIQQMYNMPSYQEHLKVLHNNDYTRVLSDEEKKNTNLFDNSVYSKGDPKTQSILKLQNFAKQNGLELVNSPDSDANLRNLYNQSKKLDKDKQDELLKYLRTYYTVENEQLKNENYMGNRIMKGVISSVSGGIDATTGLISKAITNSNQLINAALGNNEKAEDETEVAKDLLKYNILGTTAEQMARKQTKMEQVQNVGTIERFTGDVAEGISGMIPTVLISVYTQNPDLALTMMSTSAGGNAYRQAINEGASNNSALAYGTLMAIKEYTTEKMFGAANKLAGFDVKGYGDELAESIINRIFKENSNKILRGFTEFILGGVEEGLEEFVGDLIEPYIKNLTLGTKEKANLKEALYSGLVGGITGLAMSTPGTVINLASNYNSKQKHDLRNEEYNVRDTNLKTTPQNNTNLEETSPNTVQLDENNVQNALDFEKTVQSEPQIQEETVETNIGNIPVAEYRDIMAQQAGFNDYADMRRQGYKLGNKYDTDVQPTNKEKNVKNTMSENNNTLFQKGLEKFKSKNYTENDDLVLLNKTPDYFYNLGYDTDNSIVMNMSKLEDVMKEPKGYFDGVNQHGITFDIVEQLPEAINNPLNVIKNPKFRNRFVLITSLTDQYGDIVIVPIEMNTKGRIENIYTDVNKVTSVYGKEYYDTKKAEDIESYMERNKDYIVYDIDNNRQKNRSLTTNVHPGLQLSNETVSSASVNNIIPTSQNYVNKNLPTQAEQQQAQQELRNKLPTEEKKNNSKPNFMLVNEKDSYKRNMFNNNAKAINDLIKAKNTISNELTQKINAKQQLYNSKKDKTTKVAQNLKSQIINLQKRKADIEEKFIKKIDRLETRNANINKLKKQVSEDRLPTRKEIKEKIITETDMGNINLDNIKDVSKWTMNNTIPLRVNEKVFDKETATKINDTFFRPIKHNEAERIRFLNKERAEIKELGVKPRSEESEYVQIYGEGEWVNPSTGEATPYTLDDLKKKFPENWEKIKNAAEVLRAKYDTYLDNVNKELNKMGYDSIPKLKNYFRHFEETTSLLSQIGIPSKADALPTDMNGLTADLKPGKNFFANALSRTGKKTTYDAITGIDGYLEGVSKLMYHTEDIQKLRTLDEYIRGKYGRNTELEGLNKADFQKRVEQIQEGHLSEYASWLTEYTNALSGKKSRMDRGTEEALGRRVYGTLNAIKKQVGSNLTGLNLNSALSNFISITQGASKTSKIAMLEGLGDTLKNIFVKDNFINESDFLTRRFGSDKLSKTMWENISNAGQIFMAGTDYLSANIITRSKYYEYLNKGYPKNEAIKLADEFADRIMGGRALGDMPNIFNSKTLGILTQFQLENVNQFDAMFHDTKYENRANEQTKYQAKTFNEKIKSTLAQKNPKFYNGLTTTFILGQLFAYAWAYNKLDEELTGSGGAFDPIGIIEDLIKDFTNPDLSPEDAIKNLTLNVIDAIPYANILTGGGRVPMTDALPNIVDLLEGESSIGSEAWKLLNLALPTGGGQLRKTIQGAGALLKGGDYTSDGKLKFKVEPKDAAQALLFGKWSTPGGQQYIENGFKSLSKVQTEGLQRAEELGISTEEFYDIKQAIENIKVPTLKNKEGKEQAVPGARKKLIKEELNSRKNLTDEQRKLFYDIFYSKELK